MPPAPAIGQQNVATADLLVSHPPTRPCIVTLFQSDTFDNYAPRPFTYSPPADCPGPWAKVVFVAHFNENPGVQYDRTAYVFLGNAAPHAGAASIFNIVNSIYTGVIHGSGYLYFYPGARARGRHAGDDAAAEPSAVYPLNSGNQPSDLDSASQSLAGTFVFPTNMTRMDLVITAQSQIGDEFWYTCVPSEYANELESCGNSGYHQVMVQLDGRTVAYAPVSPWIYTGGIDPFLWQPTPGVQTLNFIPYRVNLTPLLAELDNGQPHTIAVSVYNDGNYFSVAANLLVYQDPRVSAIGGAVTEVDVPPLAPSITSDLAGGASGEVSGSVAVRSDVRTRLVGYLDLPGGPRWTAVAQELHFSNSQNFTINNTVYDQQIALASTVRTVTRVSDGGEDGSTRVRSWSFPLMLNYDQVQQANGDFAITTTVLQHYAARSAPAWPAAAGWALSDRVQSEDTLEFDPSFNFLGHSGMSGSQHDEFERRSRGEPLCDSRTITNTANAVSAVSDARHCDLLRGDDGGR